MEDLAAWLYAKQPLVATSIVSIVAVLILFFWGVKKGLIAVGRPRRLTQTRSAETESGRRRAVQLLDLVDEHALDMPGRWITFVDKQAEHKAGSVIQRSVTPDMNAYRARLDRLEPVAAELKADAKVTQNSVIRLEEKLQGVRESVGEVKETMDEMKMTIATNAQRTHEMLGVLIGKSGDGS